MKFNNLFLVPQEIIYFIIFKVPLTPLDINKMAILNLLSFKYAVITELASEDFPKNI